MQKVEPSLVSVIIPVYKVEEYLSACIESVLRQTYKNLEIILVDDGSPDKCPEICDAYAKKDNRIHVIHKENGGLSDARNVGVNNATGEFIYFLDSDDWVNDIAIEQMISFAIHNNLDVVEGKLLFVYPDKTLPYSDFAGETAVFLTRDEVYEFFLKLYTRTNACHKLIRKSILLENNISFKKGQISEDFLWLYEGLLPNINSCGFNSKALYFYRKGISSVSSSISERHYKSYVDIFNILKSDSCFYERCLMFKSGILATLLFEEIKQAAYLGRTDLKKQSFFRIKENRKLLNATQSKRAKFLYLLSFLPIPIAYKIFAIIVRGYKK